MGVSIELYVVPGSIDRAEWDGAYQDVRRLWSTHPSGLRSVQRFRTHGVEVPIYTRRLEHEEWGQRYCSVAGDLRSLRFAEPCALPSWESCLSWASRASSASRASWERPSAGAATEQLHDDVLFTREGGRVRLFGGQTAGEPYHRAVLAAGMIVEARLPGRAFVRGGFDRALAEEAQADVLEGLGLEVPLPVVVVAPRLARRVAAWREGPAFVRSFLRRYAGSKAEGLGHALLYVDEGAAGEWLGAALQSKPRAFERKRLPARTALAGWLRAGRRFETFCQVAFAAGVEPGALAGEVAGSGCLLPSALAAKVRSELARPRAKWPGPTQLRLAMARFSLERLELDAKLEPDALEAAFLALTPRRARELVTRARSEAAQLDAAVEDALRLLDEERRSVASLGSWQGEGDLSRVASFDEIEPGRRASLLRYVDDVYDAWNASADERGPAEPDWLRGDATWLRDDTNWLRDDTNWLRGATERSPRDARALPGDARALPGDADGLLHRFVSAMARGDLTLTEDAWDAISVERDPAVLRWLVRLAACDVPGDEARRLKRALLEGAVLRREGARLYAERAACPERRLATRRAASCSSAA
jgi:hypothetical protein